jgi:hypothetical protein
MQGSGGPIVSMPTPIEHRTASQTERKPGPGSGPKSVDPATDPHAKPAGQWAQSWRERQNYHHRTRRRGGV